MVDATVHSLERRTVEWLSELEVDAEMDEARWGRHDRERPATDKTNDMRKVEGTWEDEKTTRVDCAEKESLKQDG
jgi:hypothetical protein